MLIVAPDKPTDSACANLVPFLTKPVNGTVATVVEVDVNSLNVEVNSTLPPVSTGLTPSGIVALTVLP